jgi:NADPH2:quinone reductase
MTDHTTYGLVCSELSDDLSKTNLGELKLDSFDSNSVKISIKAASLNFPDLLMTQGKYQNRPELPFALGMEGSGIVEKTGSEVSSLKEGDEVMFGGWGHGAIAKSIILPESFVSLKPKKLNFSEAASFKTAYLTAYVGLIRRGELKKDETLLVHGASGGVGMAAVQMGKLYGARVIASGTSDEKLKIVKSWGADEVINTGFEGSVSFREKVKELTNNKGADVIYDPVGGDVFDESIRCINWGGRLLIIGFTSGRIPTVPVNYPLIKGFSVIGVRAGEFGRKDPLKGKENNEIIMELAESGKLAPHICKEFPLELAKEGLKYLKERKLVGKVTVLMS